ncbi:MAG TPA: phosphoadenylyl-sulfate reductase [Terriglobales bacterium]|nr:phosphoadenylyl-sulfate reductase [Terriglobales bacterium]
MKDTVERIHQLVEQWSPEDLLRWAFVTFGGYVEIASGFGAEGVVLIDIAARVQPQFRIFTLDTDFLFPETCDLMERIEQRYGIRVEKLKSALTPEHQEHLHGPALWSRDPDACCNLRKVEPLRKKLSQLRAWVTSIRRDQTPDRAGALKVEWDAKFHLVKINPLAAWTAGKVWRYIHDHDLPYNPLYDRGYPSIGCTHCTRSVQPGEDARAGRWSGFNKTECGLHSATQTGELLAITGVTPSERATEA